MKRSIIYFTAIVLTVLMYFPEQQVQAQPPDPPSGHGLNGNQGAGGSAPVDGGVFFLLLSSLGYGVVKMVRKRK